MSKTTNAPETESAETACCTTNECTCSCGCPTGQCTCTEDKCECGCLTPRAES